MSLLDSKSDYEGIIKYLESQLASLKAELDSERAKDSYVINNLKAENTSLKESGDAMEKSLQSLLNFGGVPLRDIYKLDVSEREKYLMARKAMEEWQKIK